MQLTFALAQVSDARDITGLRAAVAAHLTTRYGAGPWSSSGAAEGVIRDLGTSRVLLARLGSELVGTLRLTTRKPWAIDPGYFTRCATPLYLSDMAIAPAHQLRGLGRSCLLEAAQLARAWPADAIRLDAYDDRAGAGEFYARCGYREVGRVKFRSTPLVYFELLL